MNTTAWRILLKYRIVASWGRKWGRKGVSTERRKHSIRFSQELRQVWDMTVWIWYVFQSLICWRLLPVKQCSGVSGSRGLNRPLEVGPLWRKPVIGSVLFKAPFCPRILAVFFPAAGSTLPLLFFHHDVQLCLSSKAVWVRDCRLKLLKLWAHTGLFPLY